MYARNLLYDYDTNTWYYEEANNYTMDRRHWGYIGDYDFNLSGNINNRVYLGMTIGIHDVNYKHYSEYTEYFPQNSPIQVADDREIEGTGADIKLGIIFRPIETSPFRIGLSVTTPTWYDLDTHNYTTMSDAGGSVYNSEDYEFKLYTPWKFGLSLGHTIGTQLALGFGYEYSDYTSATNRVNKGDTYWYDDYGYSPSYTDEPMKRNTEKSLKGVHTIRVGAEVKPVSEFAIRLGYNYVSSPYEENGVRDMYMDSPGVSYASTTDYVNWKDTHRVTCGLGYKTGGMNIDLAYQYNMTKGDFHPFQPYAGNTGVKEVKFNRHQVLMTLGYTF
jgi:hypothetical protein